jgi:acetyltransferase-like isoleucine patch superfamily enzyme
MGAGFSRVLSRYAGRIKGSEFRIDERISPTYLAGVVGERGLMKLRGLIRFPKPGNRPFVGSHVTLRSRNNLTIGRGVTFGHHTYVDALSTNGVHLGDNTSLGRNTRIECTGSLRTLGVGLDVGKNVGLGSDNLYGCAGGIKIGDDTIVGNYVTFHSENHVIDDLQEPIRLQGVTHAGITIGRDCWIGAKVTILDGATIGDGCVIAAGSVVIAGEYADFGIYGGIPAKLIKSRKAQNAS